MKVQFAEVFEPLLTQKARYKVSDGGRGGGRSWAFARALLIKASSAKHKILCAREFQTSISASVYSLLVEQIELLGLSSIFKILKTSIECTLTGSEILFAGLHHNIENVKSINGITICWIEEAEKVSENSWNVLIPSIRGENSEMWITFNPYQESDPTYQRFIVNPPKDLIRMRAGFTENPWFPDVLKTELEHDRATNPDRYNWVWLGNPLGLSDAQVFKGKFSCEDFETPESQIEFYHGVDWGFAQDPTVMIRCYIVKKILYIDQEYHGIAIEIDKLPQAFESIPTVKRYTLYADSARPETISYLRRFGYPNMKPVPKWPKSVEDGVEYLRTFEKIVIHPRCKRTLEEFNLYSYKKDSLTNEILPIILDKYNHCIDALRYALVRQIQGRRAGTGGEWRKGIGI